MKFIGLRHIIIIFSLWAFGQDGKTQQMHLQWVYAVSTPGLEEAHDIVMDSEGNLVATGIFSGTNIDFDLGTSTHLLSSKGNTDIWMAKYTTQGKLIWVYSIGGPSWDGIADTFRSYSLSITTDNQNNLYLLGNFDGNNIDFDPGPSNYLMSSLTGSSMFIAKFNPTGSLQWAKTIDALTGPHNECIQVDELLNIYIAGILIGTADMDPGTGTTFRTSTGAKSDPFFLKLNPSGNLAWVNVINNADEGSANCLALDKNGEVLVTGHFSGNNVNFNPAGTPAPFSSNGLIFDVFFGKYSHITGQVMWVYTLGGPVDDIGYSIKSDANGDVWVAGYVSSDSSDFDPGPGKVLINALGADAFWAKYTSAGQFVYVKTLSGYSGQGVWQIDFTSDKVTLLVLKSSKYDSDIDPDSIGVVPYLPTFGDGFDAFIGQYDLNGTYSNHIKVQGYSGNERLINMVIDHKNNIYTIGTYSSSEVSFDPDNANEHIGYSGGKSDMFFLKTSPCAKAKIKIYAESSQVLEGNPLSLHSDATGNALTYSWRKDTTYLSAFTSSFFINSVGMSDSDTYSCLVTDTCLNETMSSGIPIFVGPRLKPAEFITPNGDQKNDVFAIPDLEKYKEYKIHIFNSWGMQVFHTNSYNQNWNGENLPEGNYFYVVQIIDIDYTVKGTLVINRK